jgi:hypothetical protein
MLRHEVAATTWTFNAELSVVFHSLAGAMQDPKDGTGETKT